MPFITAAGTWLFVAHAGLYTYVISGCVSRFLQSPGGQEEEPPPTVDELLPLKGVSMLPGGDVPALEWHPEFQPQPHPLGAVQPVIPDIDDEFEELVSTKPMQVALTSIDGSDVAKAILNRVLGSMHEWADALAKGALNAIYYIDRFGNVEALYPDNPLVMMGADGIPHALTDLSAAEMAQALPASPIMAQLPLPDPHSDALVAPDALVLAGGEQQTMAGTLLVPACLGLAAVTGVMLHGYSVVRDELDEQRAADLEEVLKRVEEAKKKAEEAKKKAKAEPPRRALSLMSRGSDTKAALPAAAPPTTIDGFDASLDQFMVENESDPTLKQGIELCREAIQALKRKGSEISEDAIKDYVSGNFNKMYNVNYLFEQYYKSLKPAAREVSTPPTASRRLGAP